MAASQLSDVFGHVETAFPLGNSHFPELTMARDTLLTNPIISNRNDN